MPPSKQESIMVGASSALALATYLIREGYDSDRLQEDASFSLAELEKPDQRLPILTYNRLGKSPSLTPGTPLWACILANAPMKKIWV